MSILATSRTALSATALPGRSVIATAMLAGGVLALGLTLPKALAVLSTGVFLDPDDAMRAVEMRDFMAGQAWFDLVPHRLSPDHPFVMHWSRLIDLPLAAVTGLFDLVLPPAAAERAMRLTVPSLLFLGALRLMLAIVLSLVGRRGLLPAALLLGGSAEVLGNFIPGHIHHHGAQVVPLLAATALILAALKPGARWRPAAGAGAVAALSLGIGLQNLPFVAGLATIAGVAWIVRGAAATPLLAGFGGGFGVAALGVFLLDVPPSAYGSGACDAFSTAHLLLGVVGGALCVALGATTPRLPSARARLPAAGSAALVLAGTLYVFYPTCLHDPMAGVDPLLRDKWLAAVGEALPLARLLALDPAGGATLLLTLLCGVAATLVATVAAPPPQRSAWGALLLLALIGVVGTAYQVRVAPSACALLVPGVAWAVLRVHDRCIAKPGRPALLAAVVVAVCGNGAAWAALAPVTVGFRAGPVAHGPVVAGDPATCFQPALYAPLQALPPGLVLSTIDPGSAILAATEHSVLAAPYHRNAAGNRVALLAFDAPPADARALIQDARATYVALCRASNEVAESVAQHPDGLAAVLMGGHAPDWLVPLGTGAEPLLLFRVSR